MRAVTVTVTVGVVVSRSCAVVVSAGVVDVNYFGLRSSLVTSPSVLPCHNLKQLTSLFLAEAHITSSVIGVTARPFYIAAPSLHFSIVPWKLAVRAHCLLD